MSCTLLYRANVSALLSSTNSTSSVDQPIDYYLYIAPPLCPPSLFLPHSFTPLSPLSHSLSLSVPLPPFPVFPSYLYFSLGVSVPSTSFFLYRSFCMSDSSHLFSFFLHLTPSLSLSVPLYHKFLILFPFSLAFSQFLIIFLFLFSLSFSYFRSLPYLLRVSSVSLRISVSDISSTLFLFLSLYHFL